MNAVNLIPDAAGRGRPTISASPQTLALIAGLAAVLIGALLYVSADNNVSSRKSELVRATANAASWRTAASALEPYVTASQQRAAQLTDVRQLVAARFGWSHLLDQIAQRMPRAAALSSLQASTTTGGATPTTTQPSVQLSGCAASQPTVARAMDQLRHVDGVIDVVLASSTDNSAGTGTSSSSSAASSSNGSCSYPVQFQISLTFTTTQASAP
jgi:Tfp pilus assembly protein PilN